MSETESLPLETNRLGVGEILICNQETNRKFEPIKCFIGKVILTIGGGGDKIYVVEDKDNMSSEVKSIQFRSDVEDAMKSTNCKNRDDCVKISDNKTDPNRSEKQETKVEDKKQNTEQNDDEEEKESKQIIQICKGKYHLIKLTSDGKVRCSGKPYFGVSGLGGSASSDTTILLPNLAKMKIVQISAGKFHSLALADNGDLYSWGMGFEGQLGLSKDNKVASSPRYLRFFYKKPVKFISCGHNYSLALTREGNLYGWGENKLGQLGLGHKQIIDEPTLIPILDKDGEQEGCNSSESLVNQKLERKYTNLPLKCSYASAGYSHTVVVTEEGYPVTFGLNIYGQLGLGNTQTSFEPKLLQKDDSGEKIETIVKAACSVSGTFLISNTGKLYTCGSGNIGHSNLELVKLPKIIAGERLFSHIFCNDYSVVAFCPLRILSVSPNSGPMTGGTILSIIGSAFKNFPKLSVRFIFGGVSRDVSGNFDKLSRTIFVKTPNFIEYCPNMELPCSCTIQVTFDGHYFIEYSEKFLIYPNSIKISAIEPKCGPFSGETPLVVKINLDQIPTKYLFSLTIGFQAKPESKDHKKGKLNTNGVDSKISTENNNSNIQNKDEQNVLENNVINPMDIQEIENHLDKANWYCGFSTYEKGIMTCSIPQIENFSQSQVEYNVDVSINGQQFSGYPVIYRFYDIQIEKISPEISTTDGGLTMKIYGTGLFDSFTKKGKITSEFGERNIELQWERKDKSFTFSSIPLQWMVSDENLAKSENQEMLYNKYNFEVLFTMNGTQWIKAGSYKYCNPEILKIFYVLFPDNMSDKDRFIAASEVEEELSEEEKMKLGMIPIYEDKKKAAEFEKKLEAEENDIKTGSKRPYTGLAIYSKFFPKLDNIGVRFSSADDEKDTVAIYKNKNKIICIIPEMPNLAPGVHECQISLSFNGEQWIETDEKINFNAPEKGLSFEEMVKNDDDKKKKPGKK